MFGETFYNINSLKIAIWRDFLVISQRLEWSLLGWYFACMRDICRRDYTKLFLKCKSNWLESWLSHILFTQILL